MNYGALYALWRELDTQLGAGGMARDAFRRWDEQVRSLLRGPEVDVLMRAHPDYEPISRQTEQIARHFQLRRLLLARKGADTLV